jgi:hypothetical protein
MSQYYLLEICKNEKYSSYKEFCYGVGTGMFQNYDKTDISLFNTEYKERHLYGVLLCFRDNKLIIDPYITYKKLGIKKTRIMKNAKEINTMIRNNSFSNIFLLREGEHMNDISTMVSKIPYSIHFSFPEKDDIYHDFKYYLLLFERLTIKNTNENDTKHKELTHIIADYCSKNASNKKSIKSRITRFLSSITNRNTLTKTKKNI